MTHEIDRSRAQCLKCYDIIESHHRHDFVRCECGSIFLDGGMDYVRCGTTATTIEEFDSLIHLLTEYKKG